MDNKEIIDKIKLESLEKQWECLIKLADDYERRISVVVFSTFIALLTIIITLFQWMPEQQILVQAVCMIAIPLCIFVVISWMSCNFRRQAMATSYLKKIEKEINHLFNDDEVYRWQVIYAKYDALESKWLKNLWNNPLTSFIVTNAFLLILMIITCDIMVISGKFGVLYKVIYNVILVIFILLVCSSLDNRKVRL